MTTLRIDSASALWGLATSPHAWLLVAVTVAAVFSRSGVFHSRLFQLLKPWKSRPVDRRGAPGPATAARERPAAVSPLRDPLFLLLLVVAAAAAASWVVMSMSVRSGLPPARSAPEPPSRS